MAERIRIIPHEIVPETGSFEVRFPNGRRSVYFYWDNIAGRRLRPDDMTKEQAMAKAVDLARIEQAKLDG
jgi:hypothetical protein